MANSRAIVSGFPSAVRDQIGFDLYQAQLGTIGRCSKPMRGLGGGVMEIAVSDAAGTFRTVYTVSIGDAIYVIDAFQKKSKTGIATPRLDIERIRQRLKRLREELENG